jgi:hypothetical protein
MALADYYERAALAAAQVLAGFDEEVFRLTLENINVGVAVGAEAEASAEGRAIADLCVRLLARLYPRLEIAAGEGGSALRLDLIELARAINPLVELSEEAEIGISIGTDAPQFSRTVFAGSNQFDALISLQTSQQLGLSNNPFGAGAAACLASGALFRSLFLADDAQSDEELDLVFSSLTGECTSTAEDSQVNSWQLDHEAVLIGIGAIGNGALWALGRADITGVLHLVDDQTVELSNLQRYVLAARDDEGVVKVELPPANEAKLTLVPHIQTFEQFVEEREHRLPRVLVALDSANDRRHVQASLPLSVDNAWTQPGDLGVSRHARFGSNAACLCCLYLPAGATQNEDQLVSEALRIPDRLMEVRVLLHTRGPVERPLLEAIALGLDAPLERLLPFEGRTLRELYVEGLCGGAVLPLGQLGQPRQEVHVPLAHQSALAGVLLAASLVRRLNEAPLATTQVTRLDVLRPVGAHLTQPAASSGDGRCICEDDDYRSVFAEKWSELA